MFILKTRIKIHNLIVMQQFAEKIKINKRQLIFFHIFIINCLTKKPDILLISPRWVLMRFHNELKNDSSLRFYSLRNIIKCRKNCFIVIFEISFDKYDTTYNINSNHNYILWYTCQIYEVERWSNKSDFILINNVGKLVISEKYCKW